MSTIAERQEVNSKVEVRYRQTSDGPSWSECQAQQEGQQRKSEDYEQARRFVEVQADRWVSQFLMP